MFLLLKILELLALGVLLIVAFWWFDIFFLKSGREDGDRETRHRNSYFPTDDDYYRSRIEKRM